MKNIYYKIYDADEYTEFIKNVLKLFRSSNEYEIWRSTTNNDECALTGISRDSVDIEVHHHGQTLWEIVEEIVDYFIQNDIYYNTFYICLVLTDLHFNNCISYIPIQHCIHKMASKDKVLLNQLYPDFDNYVTHGDSTIKKQIIEKWAKKIEY